MRKRKQSSSSKNIAEMFEDFTSTMGLSNKDLKKFDELARYEKIEWFKEVVKLSSGQSFGELALIEDAAKRNATIKCLSECYFAVIGRQDYHKFLRRVHQKDQQGKVDFFSQMPFLSHWTKNQITKLVLSFTEKTFCRNQPIFSQGDKAEMVYFVLSGEFEVLRTKKTI